MNQSVHARLRFAMVLIFVLLTLFGARLIQIQTVGADDIVNRAATQGGYRGMLSVDLPAKRGDIVDRTGVPLASSVEGVMVVADPTLTGPQAGVIAKVISSKTNADYFDLVDKLSGNGPDNRFAYLARRVPSTIGHEIMDSLKTAGVNGVYLKADPIRTYPNGDVAANIVGYVGEDDSPGGLEGALNRQLSGTDGKETFEPAAGNRLPLGKNSLTKPIDGEEVQLTIDRDLQWMVQRVLRSAVESSGAESGTVVVLDSRSGEILTLADYPSFNPNKLEAAREADLAARSVVAIYEPGSVQKVLTFGSLIDAGEVTKLTKMRVPGQLPVADRVVNDHFVHGTLNMTSAGVIAKSSNIGTVLASEGMPGQELVDYLTAFGLGHPTNVGLPGESKGLVPGVESWSGVSKANISFGQGLAVNAVQMATALNTIANGGEYISPSLIKGKFETSGGAVVGTETAEKRRVISPQAARDTAEMMEMVTTEGVGTAAGAKVPGYRVAGKTGTAQQPGGACRCYRDGGKVVSFGGFLPADDPRFTVYVAIRQPTRAGSSGGGTAGPVFRKVSTQLLQKYAVAPTNTPPANLPAFWGRGGR